MAGFNKHDEVNVTFTRRYASNLGRWEEGDTALFSIETACFINRDSPGVFGPVDSLALDKFQEAINHGENADGSYAFLHLDTTTPVVPNPLYTNPPEVEPQHSPTSLSADPGQVDPTGDDSSSAEDHGHKESADPDSAESDPSDPGTDGSGDDPTGEGANEVKEGEEEQGAENEEEKDASEEKQKDPDPAARQQPPASNRQVTRSTNRS